jgi:hypothetical protein
MAINVLDTLVLAVAAYRVNGNSVVNSTTLERPVTNAAMVKSHMLHCTSIEVLDEDRTRAQEIKDAIVQQVLLARLTGKELGNFVERVGLIVEKESTGRSDFGIIIWIPKIYADLQAEQNQTHELTINGYSSRYIGRIGDKVELEFTTVIKRWNKTYLCYRYTGHDGNGNLVGFFCKHEYPLTVKLRAKVKAQEESKFSGGKITYLNYTKEIK